MPNMLPLPLGITGFNSIGDNLCQVNFADFKRACYGVAMRISAHMSAVHSAEEQVEPNFHWAKVQTLTGAVYLLCNAHLPWVAFVKADPRREVLEFLEHAGLMEAWTSFPDFRVLDVGYLEEAPTPEVLKQLDPVEQRQIKFWKPQRVGDIVFNHWD